MKEYYETDLDFRLYVDGYCVQYKISVDEALTHAIVKEVYEFYLKRGA